MIIAVPLRTIQHPEYGVWSNHYYLCDHFKEIFEELGITLDTKIKKTWEIVE